MNSRDQLLDVERLGHVIVRAEVQSAYFVAALAPCRDEDHWTSSALPQHPAQLEAVSVRKLNVEQHQIRSKVLAFSQRIMSRGGEPHIKSINREIVVQERRNAAIVFDDQ